MDGSCLFADLPGARRHLVGGTGKEVAHLLESAFVALRPAANGRHVATLETLSTTYAVLKPGPGRGSPARQRGPRTEQLETLRFEAVNRLLASVRKLPDR